MSTPVRTRHRSEDAADAVAGCLDAQQRLLDRYRGRAARRFLQVAAVTFRSVHAVGGQR